MGHKQPMSRDIITQIAVVGGGHAGTLCALALASRGFDVRVVDPMGPAASQSVGRTLALLAGSRSLAEELGLWCHIHPIAHPVWTVDVRDEVSDGRVVYRSRDLDGKPLAYGLRNEELRTALAGAVEPERWVTARVAGLERGSGLLLDDGRVMRARLVVGADGRGSAIRELAHIGLERRSYGQAALAFLVRHDRDARGTVHERLRATGPLATLPVGGDCTGITWVEPLEHARALVDAGEEMLIDRLSDSLGDELGEMKLAGGMGMFPLSAQHAGRYVAPGLVLIGDAAHGVHPIHAQGFNMGVADIAELVDTLVDARARGMDIGGEALLRYERSRRPENARRLRMTDALNRIFSNEFAPLKPARRLMLDALTAVPALRRRAIRHGMQAEP